METIPLESKEYFPVKIADRLGNLVTLDGITVQFKIDKEDDTSAVGWTSAINSNMIALPLIDTSALAGKATYKLYVRFNLGSEIPVVGPFEFQVI